MHCDSTVFQCLLNCGSLPLGNKQFRGLVDRLVRLRRSALNIRKIH